MQLNQKDVLEIISRIGAEHGELLKDARKCDKDSLLKQMTKLRDCVDAEIRSLNKAGTDNRANQLNPNNPLSQKKNNPPAPKNKEKAPTGEKPVRNQPHGAMPLTLGPGPRSRWMPNTPQGAMPFTVNLLFPWMPTTPPQRGPQ